MMKISGLFRWLKCRRNSVAEKPSGDRRPTSELIAEADALLAEIRERNKRFMESTGADVREINAELDQLDRDLDAVDRDLVAFFKEERRKLKADMKQFKRELTALIHDDTEFGRRM